MVHAYLSIYSAIVRLYEKAEYCKKNGILRKFSEILDNEQLI